MSHIKLVRLEHSKDLKLKRVSISVDTLDDKVLSEVTDEIKQEYGLKQYGIGNYIHSLILHDLRARKILERLRKEEDQRGGTRTYHRETELGGEDRP